LSGARKTSGRTTLGRDQDAGDGGPGVYAVGVVGVGVALYAYAFRTREDKARVHVFTQGQHDILGRYHMSQTRVDAVRPSMPTGCEISGCVVVESTMISQIINYGSNTMDSDISNHESNANHSRSHE
jgi:hypothetical protein